MSIPASRDKIPGDTVQTDLQPLPPPPDALLKKIYGKNIQEERTKQILDAVKELPSVCRDSSDKTMFAVTKVVELAESGLPATGETVEQLSGGWVAKRPWP